MMTVTTEKRDIHRNLAVEEWLLDRADRLGLQASPGQTGRGSILFLCVNAPCVVIGKNQNPWRECRLSLMEKEGVSLARRISGGGAVYHDEGNLNFGVIVPRTEYREGKQYELIFQTLEKFGIKASKLRKNSLAVDGKKFSGQAFCFRGQHVLHHGTLLVNSDLKRLGRYLGPELGGIQTKAVASVPSEVMNLDDAMPGLTVETLSAALIEEFQIMYGSKVGQASCLSGQAGSPSYIEKNIPEAELLPITEKLSSAEWLFGQTPRFQVTLNHQRLEVEKGLITNLDGTLLFSEWLNARSAKH